MIAGGPVGERRRPLALEDREEISRCLRSPVVGVFDQRNLDLSGWAARTPSSSAPTSDRNAGSFVSRLTSPGMDCGLEFP
jgi:hypothetical protein